MHEQLIRSTPWTGSTVESLTEKYTPIVRREAFSTKEKIRDFFGAPSSQFSEQMVAYADSFIDIATRQLVFGHFKYKAPRGLDSREKQLVTGSYNFQGLFTGHSFRHELRHALVSLQLQTDKENLSSLNPLFQRVGPAGVFFGQRFSPSLRKRLEMEEDLVRDILETPLQMQQAAQMSPLEFSTSILKQNSPSQNLLNFLGSFSGYDPNDPKFFWGWSVSTTLPLMRKRAPKAVKILLEEVV